MTSNLVRATDEQLDAWAQSEALGPMLRSIAAELLQLRHVLNYTSTQSPAPPPANDAPEQNPR